MKRRRQFLLLLVSLIALTSVIYITTRPESYPAKGKKAAIVDGLSEEFPNPEFLEEAVKFLEEADFQVEVFNSSSLTVAFYENLPSGHYGIILLRVHSAPMDRGPGAALFTSERPPGEYMTEQFIGWVRIARTLTQGDRFYAVTPQFMRDKMDGEFEDTMIISMSCYGCVDDTLAKIFIEKGASTFIGWTELVGANHMDKATLVLLEKLLIGGCSVADAVGYTMEEVGEDPTYGSELTFFQGEHD